MSMLFHKVLRCVFWIEAEGYQLIASKHCNVGLFIEITEDMVLGKLICKTISC